MDERFATLTKWEESGDTDDTGSNVSEGDINEQNIIDVNGLPVDVHDKWLMNKLNDLFSKCGRIKVITMKYFIS